MKKWGVTLKLFAITSSCFLLFYTIIMIGQLLFFEQFYQSKKLDDLEKKLEAFAKEYVSREWDAESMARELSVFISRNKTQLAIVSPNGQVKYDNPFRIVIRDREGKNVKISLSLLPEEDRSALLSANLHKGDRIEAIGVFEEGLLQEMFYPRVIKKAGAADIGTLRGSDTTLTLSTVSGEITELFLPAPNQWNLRQGILFHVLKDLFPLSEERKRALEGGSVLEEEWVEPWSGVRSLVAIHPIVQDGRLSELVVALTSLQQISEANDALRLFYVYIGIGGFALILLLSLLLSKIVTKPLLSLNKSALRMARLDFSVKSPIIRNDEFGSLARSLNTMAEKLDVTLRELQQANEQLRSEMDHKQRMELIQKEFVSNASHELKTPLSIVKSFAEGLRDGVGENKRERYIEVILDETEKMEELVRDLLELAKLESKTIKLKKSWFFLSELTEEIVERLMHHFREKELRAVTILANEEALYADQEKIEQVLLNMLVNAIRHANPGSEITVRIEGEAQALRVTIENEGEQIPQEQLAFVWDRFYRIERSRNRKTGGTGLGLAIVRHILELHEASYSVRNTKTGVAFSFSLPTHGKGK
ncbi:two-component sensor histidine kinase [Brevibacillus agri]|uniref:histidine kinase n=1 Tax=Brevibacillus agri TaxID=51101 RepID=A0A3M8AHE7_9BACL|nr:MULTISPECIES: ATP-binding protein [Brevibacillus]EJL42194.1 histidine kinase,HAMP domain-containing protein,histidine kinase [Brevibacillus sp. CF112]MBY0051558.1 HAMP domain-containing protein [Brevibacillus agri]MDR9506009.1 ATP-binding protein [Brevibacillus agri]QAV12807.1 HAMP domain-containing protein [Brevibacillus agri]QHZ55347.1 HAMP domain-containing protein [Brevibacillus sp. NSP2.1]